MPARPRSGYRLAVRLRRSNPNRPGYTRPRRGRGLPQRRRLVRRRSADISTYLKEVSGIDISAKDFRTWNGTVLAAVVLAVDELEAAVKPARVPGGRRSAPARRGAVSRTMREV